MDKKQRARELRKSGMSYAKIGAALGVGGTTVARWATKKPCIKCRCDRDSRKGWGHGRCPDCTSRYIQDQNKKGCHRCKCGHDERKGWNHGSCPDCVALQKQSLNEKGCNKCECEYDSRKGWQSGTCPICVKCKTHGISREQFGELPDLCQLCGSTKKICVDHCHSLGHIRGILCNNCNTGIGMFQDDPQLLEAASEYLQAGPFQFTPHEPQ